MFDNGVLNSMSRIFTHTYYSDKDYVIEKSGMSNIKDLFRDIY